MLLLDARYILRRVGILGVTAVLNFIASSLQCIKGATLFVDLPSFPSPSVITGDSLRPDLLLETADKILYILELTIGFETNVKCNAERKEAKYST